MATAPVFGRLLDDPGARKMTRRAFRARMSRILGDTRLLWIPPLRGETTTSTTSEVSTGRVITWDADISARRSALKYGAAQSFVAASSQYGTTPDTDNASFGNGTADSAFSVLALANVTDTAANRVIVAKYNNGGAQREWFLRVNAADTLRFDVFDEDVDVSASRASDAAISQGTWRLFGATYDGGGGATAANGIVLYQDGTVIASTATNNASYVSMVNTTAPVTIGGLDVATGQFADGSKAMIAVCAGVLSAGQMAAIATLCRQFYGVPV